MAGAGLGSGTDAKANSRRVRDTCGVASESVISIRRRLLRQAEGPPEGEGEVCSVRLRAVPRGSDLRQPLAIGPLPAGRRAVEAVEPLRGE